MENLSFSKVFRYVKKFVAMAFLCSFMSFGVYHSVVAIASVPESAITDTANPVFSSSFVDTDGTTNIDNTFAAKDDYKFYLLDNVYYMVKGTTGSEQVYAIGLVDKSKTPVLHGQIKIGDTEKFVSVYKNIFDGYTGNKTISVVDASGIGSYGSVATTTDGIKFNVVGTASDTDKTALKSLTKENNDSAIDVVSAVTYSSTDGKGNTGHFYQDLAGNVLYTASSKEGTLTAASSTDPNATSVTLHNKVYDDSNGKELTFGNSIDLSNIGDKVTTLVLDGFNDSITVTAKKGNKITSVTDGTNALPNVLSKIQKANGDTPTEKTAIKCSVTDVAYAMDNSENALAIASNISAEGGKLFKKVTDKNGNVVEGTWSWVTTPSSFAEGTTTTGKLKFTPSNTDLYSGNPEVNIKVFNMGTKTAFAENAAGQKFNQYVTKDGVTYVRLGSKENTPYTWLKETIGKSGNDQRYFAFANGQALPEGTIVSIEWLSDTENAEEFNRLSSVLSNTGVYFEGNRKYLFKIHAYNPDTLEPIKDFGGKTQDIFIQRDPSWDENDIGAYYVSKDGNTEWKSKSVSLVAPWNSQTIDGELITMTHFSDNVVGDKVDVGQKLGNVLIENWDKFSEKVQALGGESKWTVDNFRKIMKDIVNASNLSQDDKDAINKWLDSSEGTSFINELIKANKSTAAEGAKKASSSSSSGTSSGTSTKTSSGTTSGTTSTTSGTANKSASTKTGDASSILPHLLTLLSGSAGAIISLKKKKRL